MTGEEEQEKQEAKFYSENYENARIDENSRMNKKYG
jgi:hypothetical protein